MDDWKLWLGFGVGVAVLIGIAIPVIAFFRYFERKAIAALEKILQEVDVDTSQTEPTVELVFHTYHGILAWVSITEHKYVLPVSSADKLLDELHRFTMRWGFFAYGALFIPALSLINRYFQRRKIKAARTQLVQ